MLESTSERLCEPGGAHYGSPDKRPAARLETLRLAGELAVPFTTGILIGIGETRRERIEACSRSATCTSRYGHIQEVIVQNFRAKPGTRDGRGAATPDYEELLWTRRRGAPHARAGDEHAGAAQPEPGGYARLIDAGINDWGGISPVTPDHVNPEAPWPAIAELAERDRRARQGAGRAAAQSIPRTALDAARWHDAAHRHARCVRASDAEGLRARGRLVAGPLGPECRRSRRARLGGAHDPARSQRDIVAKASAGARARPKHEIVRLFSRARRRVANSCCAAADELRRERAATSCATSSTATSTTPTSATYRCAFCAFSKGKQARGAARRALRSAARRDRAARRRGVAARRHRSVHAGRHPSRLHGRHLSRHRCAP